MPAVYVRVSVTASTCTVTSTLPVLAAATTPDGSASATLWTTSRVAPETATGAVSASVSWESWSASPSTETMSGSFSTEEIRNPCAGVPVTTGFTGSVRVSRLVNSGIVTWTVRGSSSTPVTTAPDSSIGFGSTVRSKSMPSGDSATFTCAATTWLTAVDGPVTLTVVGVKVISPTSMPGGTVPWSTSTGTCLVVTSSSTTWIVRGCQSRMVPADRWR